MAWKSVRSFVFDKPSLSTMLLIGLLLFSLSSIAAIVILDTPDELGDQSEFIVVHIDPTADVLSHTFVVKNSTSRPMSLQRMSMSCTCLDHSLPQLLEIPARGEASLTMQVRTSHLSEPAENRWSAIYELESPNKRSITFSLTARMIPRISLDIQTQPNGRVLAFQSSDYSITIPTVYRIPSNEAREVPQVSCNGRNNVVCGSTWEEWATTKDGEEIHGVIKIDSGFSSTLSANIMPEPKAITISIKYGQSSEAMFPIRIHADTGLELRPQSLFFNAQRSGEVKHRLVLDSKTPIQILGVSLESDSLEIEGAELEQTKSSHEFMVVLKQGHTSKPETSSNPQKTLIKIRTDHSTCKELTLPAYIRWSSKKEQPTSADTSE